MNSDPPAVSLGASPARSPAARCRRVEVAVCALSRYTEIDGVIERQQQVADAGEQRGAVVLGHHADALAAAGCPVGGQRIVAAAEIVIDAGRGILVVEQPEVRLEPERCEAW